MRETKGPGGVMCVARQHENPQSHGSRELAGGSARRLLRKHISKKAIQDDRLSRPRCTGSGPAPCTCT